MSLVLVVIQVFFENNMSVKDEVLAMFAVTLFQEVPLSFIDSNQSTN